MKIALFVKNTIILTAYAIVLRLIGMMFRIYMTNKIGAECTGLYQLIFSVYMLAAACVTGGISVAVTRLVADASVCGNKADIRRIMRKSIGLTVFVGVIVTTVVFLLAPVIGQWWIKDVRSVASIRILAFSLPFMGVSSCVKGYFTARRNAITPSNAQMFEQFVRIFMIGLLLIRFASPDIARTCAYVLIGDTVAECCSCVLIWFLYKRDYRKLQIHSDRKQALPIIRSLLRIAVPISAGRLLNSFLRTTENMLIPQSLQQYGGSKTAALEQFGMLKGMAMPLLFFPSSMLLSMSSLLIPEISQAHIQQNDQKIRNAVNKALKITLQISILIGGLFVVTAQDLGYLIYQSGEVGFLIRVLAPIVPFMYLECITDGILKGLNQQNHSLLYTTVDSVLRILLIFILVPQKGMAGFLMMMIFSNVFTSILNLYRLIRVSEVRFDISNWICKPLLATVPGIAAGFFLQTMALHALLRILLQAGVFGGCYAVVLWSTKGVCKSDFRFIRQGKSM